MGQNSLLKIHGWPVQNVILWMEHPVKRARICLLRATLLGVAIWWTLF